jgi:hypothetical protein
MGRNAQRRRARKSAEVRPPAPPAELSSLLEDEDDGCPVCVAARTGDRDAVAAAIAASITSA